MNLRQNSGVPSQNTKKTIIAVQWVVVIGVSYFLLFSTAPAVERSWILLLVLVLLTSILTLQHLPQSAFSHPYLPHLLAVVDTILISMGIGFSREQPWDLFLVFSFGLFIVALGESLKQVVMGSLMISILSVFIRDPSQMDPDLLVRIPFLFGVLILYGALADQVRNEKRKAEQRQAALQDVNNAITSTLDLRSILDILLEKFDLLLPYSAATVRLWNEESRKIEPVACRNLDEEEWKAERWRGGRGIPNMVFESKAPRMVSNIQTDPRVLDPEFFRKHGLVSYLGVPLTAREEILGVLSFYTKEEHQFSHEEVEFLSTLASQAAVAIHNSQLYKKMADLAGDLAKSNRIKDEFLSVMSHELRTPLNVVMGYTGMVKDGMLGEMNQQQGEALGKVLTRSRDLLSMITSILQVTSIEADEVKMESHVVGLVDFLSELTSSYAVPLDKEVVLVWDYSSELPVLSTDSAKLKQIFQNLINNAIKFTEKGHVIISVRYFPEAKSLEIKVADSGIGISKEMLPAIFDKFYQVDSSETRRYGGVGLGLYIVKKFTELLGGKVGVESELNKGSIFTVTIPQND